MNMLNKIAGEILRPFSQLYHFIATELLLRWAQRQLQKRDPQSLTFAVVSRLTVIELPYIRSFIDHYFSLGVNVLYLINTRPPEFEEISTYLKDYIDQGQVQLYNVVGKVHVDHSHYQLLPKVKEDFVINVDIDEFFIIKPFKRLHEFVALNLMRPYYLIWWTAIVNDAPHAPAPPYKTCYLEELGKYMVYKPIIRNLANHWPNFVFHKKPYKNKKFNYAHRGQLLHFFGRTFNDTLLKVVKHKITGSALSSSSKEELLALLEQSDIPVRLKYIAWLAVCRKHQFLDNVQEEVLKIDYKLEQAMLERYLTPEQITQTHIAYQHFKHMLKTVDIPSHLSERRKRNRSIVSGFLEQLKY